RHAGKHPPHDDKAPSHDKLPHTAPRSDCQSQVYLRNSFRLSFCLRRAKLHLIAKRRKGMIHRMYQPIFLFGLLLSIPAICQQEPVAGSQVLEVQDSKIRVVTVATGLVHPWSLALLPDGRTLLVTEKGG